jgi:hypothetical protein
MYRSTSLACALRGGRIPDASAYGMTRFQKLPERDAVSFLYGRSPSTSLIGTNSDPSLTLLADRCTARRRPEPSLAATARARAASAWCPVLSHTDAIARSPSQTTAWLCSP